MIKIIGLIAKIVIGLLTCYLMIIGGMVLWSVKDMR